jgi:hypothetical protein
MTSWISSHDAMGLSVKMRVYCLSCQNLKFEVPKTLTMKISFVLTVTSCGLLDIYRHFGEINILKLDVDVLPKRR